MEHLANSWLEVNCSKREQWLEDPFKNEAPLVLSFGWGLLVLFVQVSNHIRGVCDHGANNSLIFWYREPIYLFTLSRRQGEITGEESRAYTN